MTPGPTPHRYFRDRWSSGDDPWNHGARWYEGRKYDLTVAALPRPRYGCAFEPACGPGFLTARLAERAERVVALEREPEGVDSARRRCASRANVSVERGIVPADWPHERFDLVVVSEVLYYLGDHDLELTVGRLHAAAAEGADIVAVHYRRHVPDHARSGDDVHRRLRDALGEPDVAHGERAFVLDVWSATGAEQDESR